MPNKTANLLKTIAYSIWILGALGILIIVSSISSTFQGTMFEALGSQVSMIIFFSSGFSVFSTGMVFYGLYTILSHIGILESRNTAEDTPSNDEYVGSSKSDDVLKF